MQIVFSGHHVEVTDAIRQYVETKLQRLGRRAEDIMSVHVILNVEKLSQKAEATVQLQTGTLHAEETNEDMYAAIDGLVDKIDRQLMKQKEKKQSFRAGGKSAGQLDAEEQQAGTPS